MANEETLWALEEVYLRLAQASGTAQLTAFCEKYLPFLLDRLEVSVKAQPADLASRDKILEILTQLKKRLRSNPETVLPFDFLLGEYRKDSSALIKNFSYLFLKIGFARLSLESQISCASSLLEAAVSKSYDQQLGIWFHLLPVIREYYGPGYRKRTNENPKATLFDLSSFTKEFTSKFLDFCGDVILLSETATSERPRIRFPAGLFGDNGFGDDGDDHDVQAGSSFAAGPNGTSAAFHKTLMEEAKTPSLEYLTGNSAEAARGGSTPLLETKIGIVRMLSSCRLPSAEIAWLWAIASADAHHSVVHEAEMQLKQAPGSGLNDAISLRKLYERYLGTSKTQTIPEAERRNAVGLKTKLKLMSFIVRYADTAASILPQSVQIVFENWFGRDLNDRLRLSGTELALHVVTKLQGQMAALFAPIMFANVRKLLASTGDPKLGCACYAVMGKLGKLHSNFVLVGTKRIEAIQELFDDLSQIENEDICAAVQSCLLEWLDGFSANDIEVGGTLLEACILAYSEHKSQKCRLTALRFLEKLFSPDHAPSRFALFLASADPDEKVRREAIGILRKPESGPTAAASKGIGGGTFDQACRYFSDKVTRLFERQDESRSALPAETLEQIITYLHDRLLRELKVQHEQSRMEVVEDRSVSVDSDEAINLNEYFGDAANLEQWRPYFELIMLFLDKFGTTNRTVIGYLAEIIFLCPPAVLQTDLLPTISPFIPRLLDTLHSSSNEALVIRLAEIVAYLFALTKSRMEIEREVDGGLQNLKADTFLKASKVYLHTLLYEMVQGEPTDLRAKWIPYSRMMCDRFRRAVSNWEVANLDVLLNGLKTLGLNGALREALPDDESRRQVSSAAVEVIQTRKDIVASRHKERAVDFIGCWLTGEADLPQWKNVMEEIMKSAEGPPNIGLQPAIGTMLVAYCVSPIGVSPYVRTQERYSQSAGELRRRLLEQFTAAGQGTEEAGKRMKWLLDSILVGQEAERLSKNKNYKQASCVWMEVFLENCGQCPGVQEHFDRLQTFFISCLAEQNDFTQDVASRCLSLLFHCTQTVEQRSVLARSMREQLTATTAKETLLPYQEMCSLCAANCQRPELIYDMMLLALNRRSSEGTSRGKDADKQAWLITNSAEKLKTFERVLVPAVFRLTYDPNPNVKRVAQNLWTSMSDHYRKMIVENDETKGGGGVSLMEKYSTEIFDHLLYSLESNQWRYREASCVALNDLLNSSHVGGLALEKVGDLWQRGLRVLDDIKDSVALAAVKMINALNKFTIRLCSSDGSPSAILPIVVPQLIEFGLQSNAKLVRLTSLITLMSLIKEAPPTFLKPHLPTLMPSLLDALTWTEGEKINYLSVRAGAEERDQIDQARIAASKSSPIMDTLETCCRHVDSVTLQALIPKLVQTLQANVGLPTKSGACRLVIMLRTQAPTQLSPFADSLLKCLTHSLTDRNTSFRKQAASVIGHIAPLCTDPALDQFFKAVQKYYLENPSLELSCCHALRSVASYAPEVLNRFGNVVAPIAFLASQYDRAVGEQTPEQILEAETVKTGWDEVLSELTLSTHTMDVYDFCARLLTESPSWHVKAVSAKSIGAVVGRMDPALPYETVHTIVSLLIKSLDGRTWDGKEAVFTSLGGACEKYKAILIREMPENEKAALVDTMLRECQKTNKPKYRIQAVTQTASIADVLELALWKRLYDIVAACLQLEKDEDTEDEEAVAELRRVSYVGLARCLNLEQVEKYSSDARRFGSLLLDRLPVSIWRDQAAILDAIQLIFNKRFAHLVFDDIAVMDIAVRTLGNVRQSALKNSCIAIIRACWGELVQDPDRLESWKKSPAAVEIMNRFFENETAKTLAKDLVDQVRESCK